MKEAKWIIVIVLIVIAIRFFAPPIVDFSGRGSKFKQWMRRYETKKWKV